MALDCVCPWLIASIGSSRASDSTSAGLDYVCLWLIVGVGVVTGIILHKRFGRMGVPAFGIFVIAADAHLYWSQCVAAFCLQKIGWWESAARLPFWNATWALLPVVLLAFLAFWLVTDAGKVKLWNGHGEGPKGELC